MSQEQQDQAEILAKCTLEAYTEELALRFSDGGNYDTYKIATGETFVEIVCGGYMQGRLPVRCYEPLTAVQLFIDAMERYFVTKPYGQVLHWRTRPEWKKYMVDEIDRWHFDTGGSEDHRMTRIIYSIYTRLALV